MLDTAPSVAFFFIALFLLAAHRALRRTWPRVPLAASLALVALPMWLLAHLARAGEAAEGLALALIGMLFELGSAVRRERGPSRRGLALLAGGVALVVAGCDGPLGSPDAPVAEGDVGLEVRDGGGDTSSPMDAAEPTDAPDAPGFDAHDAFAERDGGGDGGLDAGPRCPPGLGAPCDEASPCPSGYACDVGLCRPQGRELCGGIVAMPCLAAPYTECAYFRGADFGSCYTPDEVACACADRELSADLVCP